MVTGEALNIRVEVLDELQKVLHEHQNVYLVVSDMALLSRSGGDMFPADRVVDVGIAEQNMIGVASGLAYEGKICFTSTIAAIEIARALEQIRLDCAYPDLPVNLLGQSRGLVYGVLGCTHSCPDDIGMLRSFPNLRIIIPADSMEGRKAVRAVVENPGPTYIGLGGQMPAVYTEDYHFQIGKAVEMKEGSDVTIIAVGDMVACSLDAAGILKEEGINARVLNMHTLKPLDEGIILEAARQTGAIVTVEDHYLTGGLRESVASVLIDVPVPMKRIAIPNEYHMIADFNELLSYYKMDSSGIISAVKSLLKLDSQG